MLSLLDKMKSIYKSCIILLKYFFNEVLFKGFIIQKKDNDCSLVYLVARAHNEWIEAKRFFEEVNDPDLVDHAVYAIQAAEKKYIYLLKMARREKVINKNIYQICESRIV